MNEPAASGRKKGRPRTGSTDRGHGEPLFNVPGPVLAIAAAILIVQALQGVFGEGVMVRALGLFPSELVEGRWWEVLTVLFVHGSWAHAGLNTLALLAFGPPVVRWFGAARWPRFLLFYVVCALASSAGYIALHWEETTPLVGASGAISGLMGASSRLLERRDGLAPFASRTVVAMALAWLAINLLMATGFASFVTGPGPVAWEAHLAGYVAGLLLIGPFSRGLHARSPQARA